VEELRAEVGKILQDADEPTAQFGADFWRTDGRRKIVFAQWAMLRLKNS
jgi:hypothetical protein